MILPVRLDGAQYTPFSRLKGKVRIRWFPKLRVQFLPPQRFDIPEELRGRRRRQVAGDRLYDLMTDMMLASSDRDRTLFESLIDARHTHGAGHLVLEDVEMRPLSYRRLMTGAFALGRGIARETEPGERVGVLLPNVLGAAVTFFALHAWGRVPAMLNFSTGAASAVLACRAAQVGYLLTSRRFVEMGRLGDLITAINGVPVETWEEMADRIGHSNGQPLEIAVARPEGPVVLAVTPELITAKNLLGEDIRRYVIGIGTAGETYSKRLSLLEAVSESFRQTYAIVELMVVIVVKLLTGDISIDTVGGPIMIAQMAGDQAKAGVSSLFQFIAVISVNLAVINLLPIPVLDGGHLLFFLIEAVMGRPVNLKVREIAQQVGMVILIMLMILVFYNDIIRLFFSS